MRSRLRAVAPAEAHRELELARDEDELLARALGSHGVRPRDGLRDLAAKGGHARSVRGLGLGVQARPGATLHPEAAGGLLPARLARPALDGGAVDDRDEVQAVDLRAGMLQQEREQTHAAPVVELVFA